MSDLIFYHAPQTRSFGVRVLLEELEVAYDMHPLRLKKGEHRQENYLAINPMGKVPTIKHKGIVVTEQVAIYIYLADAFPEKKLAPAFDDPIRGDYLRWLVFYASCLEPAVVDKALERDAGRKGMSPYGDYETVIKVISGKLKHGPYLLGERFTAADLLWGTALQWLTAYNLVPLLPEIETYMKLIATRPLVQKAQADDEILAKQFSQNAG